MNDHITIDLSDAEINTVTKHVVDKTARCQRRSFNDAVIFLLKKALTPESSEAVSGT